MRGALSVGFEDQRVTLRTLLFGAALSLAPYASAGSPTVVPASEEGAFSSQFLRASSGYDLIYIPEGRFWMGSVDGAGYENEHPRHEVYLDGYYFGKTEVTVGQYRRFCRETGRELFDQGDHGDTAPVVYVTWNDATAFCSWAGLRLPTEAEWEKAARGGSTATFWWGDVASHNSANYTGISGADTWDDVSPVGSFPPNPFGAYDTAGNVWEWVNDRYGSDYYKGSPDTNPAGPREGKNRVLRGGSWDGPSDFMRPARRAFDYPDYESDLLGFRCASSK